MSNDPRQTPSLFTHIDVSTASTTGSQSSGDGSVTTLLCQMVSAQNRQNELLEQLIQQMNAAQRQRALPASRAA